MANGYACTPCKRYRYKKPEGHKRSCGAYIGKYDKTVCAMRLALGKNCLGCVWSGDAKCPIETGEKAPPPPLLVRRLLNA